MRATLDLLATRLTQHCRIELVPQTSSVPPFKHKFIAVLTSAATFSDIQGTPLLSLGTV